MSSALSGSAPVIPPAPSRRGLRAEHAALTRRLILQAARELFADTGYATVSVKQLATRAGVSIQTIYDTFGSKAGVVRSFAEIVEQDAGILEGMEELGRTDDPRRMLGIVAAMRRQTRERCGDIERLIGQAAADPDIAAARAEGMRRRHQGQLGLARRLEAAGALRPGLDAQQAADILAALTSEDVCAVLIDQRGWSFDAYERWLAEALATLVLRPPAAAA